MFARWILDIVAKIHYPGLEVCILDSCIFCFGPDERGEFPNLFHIYRKIIYNICRKIS